ncbi:MAG: hypothetical protein JNG84_13995 [Archangium sp.]|nr:hypothetical protein [Archangium sp.]
MAYDVKKLGAQPKARQAELDTFLRQLMMGFTETRRSIDTIIEFRAAK